MLVFLHALISLLLVTRVSAKPIRPNLLAGTWNLTSLTSKSPQGTVTYPIGATYGRLIFTPELFYTVQINRADYASHDWTTAPESFRPGTSAENAAVLASSFAESGVYRVDKHGLYAGVTITGSIIPNFVGGSLGPPVETLTLGKRGEELVEKLTEQDGTTVQFVWKRIERL